MEKKITLTAYQLKIIAIFAMFIDHLAWQFPLPSSISFFMHLFGRLTAPIMCFFIAEGYRHTRSFWRYFFRLLIFAFISQVPFVLFANGGNDYFHLNIIFNLALGLLAIFCYEQLKTAFLKISALLLIMLLSLKGDWSFFAVFLCLLFHIYRDSWQKQFKALVIMALLLLLSATSQTYIYSMFHFGIFLALPLLRAYNGQRGGGRYAHWLFYAFYPSHLLLIWYWSL